MLVDNVICDNFGLFGFLWHFHFGFIGSFVAKLLEKSESPEKSKIPQKWD